MNYIYLLRLLNNDTMGGGANGGHAMVVALHLYKSLKSSRKFTEQMTTNFDVTIKGVECLTPFKTQLQVYLLWICCVCVCVCIITFSVRVHKEIIFTVTPRFNAQFFIILSNVS